MMASDVDAARPVCALAQRTPHGISQQAGEVDDGRWLLDRALGQDVIVLIDDPADRPVCGKPAPGLLDMPGVTPEQVGRSDRLLRPDEAGPFGVAIASPDIRGPVSLRS
jgi:hypothetical protein